MKSLIAAVLLGGVFGSASAEVESIEGDVMVVEMEVEVVGGAADNVVAHLTFDRDPPLVLPMLEREAGVFGLRTELDPKNYVVVFEVVGEAAHTSEPVTLAQMGADLLGDPTPGDQGDEEEGLSSEASQLLWLAVALGAASLSLLAFWVLGGRDRETVDDDAEVVVVDEPDAVVVERAHRGDVVDDEDL